MNGHPIAGKEGLVRKDWSQVIFYNLRRVPESVHSTKWAVMAGQWTKCDNARFLLLDFCIDPGGPGSHPGESRTHSGAEKYQENTCLSILHFWSWGPCAGPGIPHTPYFWLLSGPDAFPHFICIYSLEYLSRKPKHLLMPLGPSWGPIMISYEQKIQARLRAWIFPSPLAF